MSKHEMLPFKMIVERGRLIPAEPYDAERLDTWRNGTLVNVTFVRDGGRVMERKWWAILNRAVKECKTPWKTAAEASEAIKLAIGVVNLTKTVGGDYLAYPKSLTDLDDPELDEAVQQMIDVVHHVTGVDPDEWRKQVSHIRDDEPSSAVSSDDAGGADTADGGTGDAGAPTDTAGADGAGEEAAGGQSAEPAPDLADEQRTKLFLLDECAERMIDAATYHISDERADRLDKARMAWVSELPNDKDFVQKVYETCSRLIENPAGRDQALPYLTGQARKWLGVA